MPRLLLALPIVLACAASPLAACSAGGSSTGGGTGGGYGMGDFRNIQPDYQDESQARELAAKSSSSGGGYVVALQKSKTPIGVWTDRLKDLSGKMPFVRLEDDAAQRFADKWKISYPAVGICDQFGNLLDVTSGQLSASKISGMIERLPEARQATVTAIGLYLRKAIDAANAGKTADALAIIAKIGNFTGYQWCAKAEELRQTLIERGFQALAAAKEKPATEIRTALVALRRDYAGTSVADEASQTLKTLK